MNALFKSLKLVNKTNRMFVSKKQKLNRSSSTIYVVRLLRNRENLPINQQYWLGNSKPCEHCQQFLAHYNVNKIKYTDIIDGVNVLCEMRLT